MIRQAILLSDAAGEAAAPDSHRRARMMAELRRHSLDDVALVAGGAPGLRDALPQPENSVLVLDAAGWLDINLWDLAAAGPAVAVTPDGEAGGAAVLDAATLARLPGQAADAEALFAALAADAVMARRAYDRPRLDFDADVRRGAVIFDRDGVLNEDSGYPYRPDQIVWTATAMAAVKAVNDAGLYAFVATNQSGIARGLYAEQDVRDLHAWMNGELIAAGAHIDAFAYSPFHPEGTIEGYRRDSDCRKPGPLMLNRLIEAHLVERGRTVMIGDRPGDVAAGQAAGVEGLLFEGGDLAAFLAPVIARLRA